MWGQSKQIRELLYCQLEADGKGLLVQIPSQRMGAPKPRHTWPGLKYCTSSWQGTGLGMSATGYKGEVSMSSIAAPCAHLERFAQ